MTQLNTPYPSAPYLTGFLRAQGVHCAQEDLALGLVLTLLSTGGLRAVHAKVQALPAAQHTASTRAFNAEADRYVSAIAPAIAFLQGKDPTLAQRIAGRAFLPEGPRFNALRAYGQAFAASGGGPEHGADLANGGQDDRAADSDYGRACGEAGDPLDWAFGALGVADRARHLATLFLNDIADVVRDAVDARFEFVRYGESLARAQPTFDPLAAALAAPPTVLDSWLADLTRAAWARHQPDLVLISVPFPGAVYGAFRIAQTLKALAPGIRIALGGGYVNTELRSLAEPRVFNYFDFVTLDAGERPLLALIDHLAGGRTVQRLVRTFVRDAEDPSLVRYVQGFEPDIAFEDVGTPTWQGLPLNNYLSLLDMLNPMHRLWSDGRWNKLTVAHGCYWKKCSFCDVGLDYISRYDAASAETLVNRIQTIVAETGQSGFHFVDEAAPPKSLKAMADELLRRNVAISWWGNIRFEKTFTPELCDRLAQSGCIAMSGGLEVASDRLLDLMQKGVSVDQVARVTKALSDAGILVHAYLMYGFPTQTVQDTIDALDTVRQLFAAGCIQSGFFHRFVCTVHSPVGQRPQDYGVALVPLPEGKFARNDIGFIDPTGIDHDAFAPGLKKAMYNFMHGIGLDADVREWFDFPMPKARVGKRRIARALEQAAPGGACNAHRT